MKNVETKPGEGIAVVTLDPRTREGRAAKLARQVTRTVDRVVTCREVMRQATLLLPDVSAAIRAVEHAKVRRDSVSRKLCGGSSAVTISDLASLEQELIDARKVLGTLAEFHPALATHPLLAA